MSWIATVTFNPSLDEWVTLPSLRPGHLHRATSFTRYPGGKGINVSRVVRELSGRTIAFGIAGGDDGAILLEGLRRLRLPYEFVHVRGTTRNNYKLLTASPRCLTEISGPGPRVSQRALTTLERRFFRRQRTMRCAALSGSLPPGVGLQVYPRWLRRLRDAGIPAVLDTSGQALRAGLKARPWLIKPNRPETEELLGRRLRGTRDVARAAQELRRLGPEHVIISLGAGGAVLASAGGTWQASPPRVRTDSPVGAGDSLVGGLLTAWVRRADLVSAFRQGVACGTACAVTPGTALCRREDVRRILPRVTVKRLA